MSELQIFVMHLSSITALVCAAYMYVIVKGVSVIDDVEGVLAYDG